MERLTKYLWDLFTSFEVRMRLIHVTEVTSESLPIKYSWPESTLKFYLKMFIFVPLTTIFVLNNGTLWPSRSFPVGHANG
jgi:hypothetical protein